MKKIAVEEAFATERLLKEWIKLLESSKSQDPGFESIYKPLTTSPAMQPLRSKLLDADTLRLADMDAHGIDMHILSLTAPGVQVFKPSLATELTTQSNDHLLDLIKKHPSRFRGLMTVAPQAPDFSVNEILRLSKHNGIVGIIINSHCNGDYLDDNQYFPIFECAEALNLPIYLHPSTPSPSMAQPYLKYGLEGPLWGFAAETALHALRLLLSGLFDRLPNLQIILGHLGEGLPYWLHRLNSRIQLAQFFDKTGKVGELQRLPAEYLKDNFYYASSGMNEDHVLRYVSDVIGISRMLFAVDYPYESSEEAIAGINQCQLTTKDKEKLLYTNASELFDIKLSN